MEKKTTINGYVLEDDFSHIEGEAQWTFAVKDGKHWFIKRFQDPVWPNTADGYDEEYLKWQREKCKRFFQEKRKLYDSVNACANGNIVTIHDFFLVNGRYHAVTERVFNEPLTMKDIARLEDKDKHLLMLTLCSSLMKLHEKGIVYADLRPDNILFKRSETGKIISKLIDFDGSFFEGPELPDRIPVSPQYIAPETGQINFFDEKAELTMKVDVFSLALMFHLYWTGELPGFDRNEYDFAFIQVLDGKKLELSAELPAQLADLMDRMLLRNPEDRPVMAEVFDKLKDIMTPKRKIYLGSYFYIPLDFS